MVGGVQQLGGDRKRRGMLRRLWSSLHAWRRAPPGLKSILNDFWQPPIRVNPMLTGK
jgi:hypothetical protein